ncbi:uncharacterized protein LOC133392293 [Anopheles gambiae]|uniref:uncharacterized protein LOC133392293 n=1 Tax=Anopheles gambiae TaxID=7165 RepID=UPI001AAD4A67|nr:uncharacterized protein LOC133392293 [Anopheles gambiae]
MQLTVMRPYQNVLIFLLVLNFTLHCDASCSFGLGERVPGERLLHTITITKGPYELDQMIEMNLDYRVSPLQNEEITFIQLDGTADGGCSALISNSVDRRKQLLGTVQSARPVKDFTLTVAIHGIMRINAQ